MLTVILTVMLVRVFVIITGSSHLPLQATDDRPSLLRALWRLMWYFVIFSLACLSFTIRVKSVRGLA